MTDFYDKLYHFKSDLVGDPNKPQEGSHKTSSAFVSNIDITAALRAVFYIARVLACNILYLPEGASPRRRYFRIARRAQRARVLYDNTALKCEDDIVYIHQRAFHQVDMEYIHSDRGSSF